MPRPLRRQLCILLICLCPIPWMAFAQQPSERVNVTDPVEQIQAQLKMLQSSSEIEASAQAAAVETYQQALEVAKSGAGFRTRTREFRQQSLAIPAEIRTAKQQLAVTSPVPRSDAWEDIELSDLDLLVQQQTTEVDAARQKLTTLSNEIEAKKIRLLKIPGLLADALQRLSTIEKQINADVAPAENVQVASARSLGLKVRRDTVQAEIESLTAEQNWLTARLELVPLHRDLTKKQLDALEASLLVQQRTAQRKREKDVDDDVNAARELATKASDELTELADANVEAAMVRRQTEFDLDDSTTKKNEVQKLLDQLGEQFSLAQKEASTRSAITQTIGEVLRKKREELQTYEQQLLTDGKLKELADGARVQRFLLGEELTGLDDIESATQLKAVVLGVGDEDIPMLRQQLELRKSLLAGLKADSETLSEELVRLESTQESLRALVDDYTHFIDERVLWIRSTDPFWMDHTEQALASAQGLASPSDWLELARNMVSEFLKKPLIPTGALILFALMLGLRRRFLQRLQKNGELAASSSCREFGLTLSALLLTAGVAAIWPAFFYLIGSWLNHSVAPSDASQPLAHGLIAASAVWFPLAFWRHSARAKGLMASHFSISERVSQLTGSSLRLFTVIVVPLVGLIAGLAQMGQRLPTESLGRVLFCVAMVATAWFCHRMLHPTKGILLGFLSRRRHSFAFRSRYLWFSLLLAVPCGLAILSLLGFQFTAEQLATRIMWTFFAILGLLFLINVALRWVLLSRRRLAMEQARERLAKMSAQGETGCIEAQADLESIDLNSVDHQTRRLLRVATVVAAVFVLWSLWSDVLPALSRFDEMRAWEVGATQLVTSSESPPAQGAEALLPKRNKDFISYSDVVIAIIILVGTVFAMRDVPGLLELLLLQHLPLDVALRFAITTLTRYVIFIVGIIWACGRIHLGWSQMQWLVAGVSVGLGFGLQEIFANFVSGLIVLFERPLRAGDIVTIDGVTGVVKDIRLRSTVIQDWDRKDLIVPNKDFVTGRLLNWTLNDEVNRIVVPVGVAYGTDTAQAKSILREIATKHPLITDSPGPLATFEEFGDSSLNLVLRCYIQMENMPYRLRAIDELHTQIDEAFRAAGIEIPFPQRDLHVRTTHSTESANGLGDGGSTSAKAARS